MSRPSPEEVTQPQDGWGPLDLTRVGEIVLAAAALDPGEREGYLRQVTLTQPILLAEVRRRLALAASLPDSFLAVPAAELLAVTERIEPDEQTSSADRYALEDRVGQGGMATVYKAFDRQLQRPVALKLLDRTAPEARRRFLGEAQAQARVRHDNVLEVYETGELGDLDGLDGLDGRPFIAMRWVDGPTLLALRDETSLEQKIRLIAQVAEGLHAAHREGLIHRDVKPSNILVEKTPDGDWKPWIADFGIAVWSGSGPAELAGTPSYLAPELLQELTPSADRRSDVYGLGVALYELLTGTVPFTAPDLTQLLQQIREQAPPPPRQLVAALPAELEAIVLKCLEKKPEARYPSARALAEDLRRYLDGDVVEAHTATLAYRLTKFVLRHRRLLWVSATAAVLLIAALAVAAWLGVVARTANRRAELRRGQAEDLIGFMLTDLRDKLEPLGKLEILDGVGKRAMGYFASVPRKELSDDELARRSQALYQIGDVRIRQGKLSQALAPLEESLSLAQALADRNPSADRLFGLGQSEFWLGYVHWEQGNLTAARPHFEVYRDLSERLVRMDPRSTKYQMELAYADSNLGSLQRQALDPEGALVSFRRSLAIKQQLVQRDPANKDWRFELAATHDLIGHTLMELNRLDEAQAPFAASLALRQALVAQDPASFKFQDFLGTSHDSLTAWCEARGLVDEALAHARSSEQIFTTLSAHDPANQLWSWKLELSRRKEGHLLALRGEVRKGVAILSALVETVARRAALEPTDRRWPLLLAWVHFDLGDALRSAGRAAEARPHAVQAVEGLKKLLAQEPKDQDLIRWHAKSQLLLSQIDSAEGGKP